MVLVVTITVSPATAGPPQGLYVSGAFQTSLPSAAFRQKIARSPSFSLSRNDEATSTLSPATSVGASTCQRFWPWTHTVFGSGLSTLLSLGGTAKSGSFFLSSSYFASSFFQCVAWSSG